MTGARSCGCSFACSRHGMGLQHVGAGKRCVSGADGAAGVLGGRSERCQRFLLAGWSVSDDIMTGCTWTRRMERGPFWQMQRTSTADLGAFMLHSQSMYGIISGGFFGAAALSRPRISRF